MMREIYLNYKIMMREVYLILFFTLLFLPATAQSEKEFNNTKNISMMPIVEGLYETIETLEKENVKIVRIEFDAISSKKSIIRKLSEKYTYGVMVYGDYRIKKIDIRILKKEQNKWQLLESGEVNSSSSIVHIEPNETGNYKIELEVIEFAEGYSFGHYGLIIIHN